MNRYQVTIFRGILIIVIMMILLLFSFIYGTYIEWKRGWECCDEWVCSECRCIEKEMMDNILEVLPEGEKAIIKGRIYIMTPEGKLEEKSEPESEIQRRLLLEKIITCESEWDAGVCNKEYGCEGGMGLAQFIPDTWDYVMKEMGRDGSPFDAELNYQAALYLLKIEGNQHWQQSQDCWGK